jgi:hypothetical protein
MVHARGYFTASQVTTAMRRVLTLDTPVDCLSKNSGATYSLESEKIIKRLSIKFILTPTLSRSAKVAIIVQIN